MRILPILAISGALGLGLASVSAAQDQGGPAPDPAAAQNPAMKSPKHMIDAPLAKGRNSFTQSEAVNRIRSAGYADVNVTTLDADGLWQGTATHNGQSVHVALDYKGNVASQ